VLDDLHAEPPEPRQEREQRTGDGPEEERGHFAPCLALYSITASFNPASAMNSVALP
jgi:hypothetical protein